jgi:hypothetical protein
MTVDDDLRLIEMIRTLFTKLEVERDAFEAAVKLRPPKARRMSDEIRDTLRARTPMAAVSGTEQDASAAGDIAARSIQAVHMALENKPEAPSLAKALGQAKDDLKKWEDQAHRLRAELIRRGWRN